MKQWNVTFETTVDANTEQEAIEQAKLEVHIDGDWEAFCIGDNGEDDEESTH